MVLVWATALRASSIARSVRPTRALRVAESQPWRQALQRGGRRAYASAHGSHGATKSSDLPWIVGGVTSSVVGGYIVVTQDLGHGEEHGDEHHEEKHEDAEEAPAEEEEEEPKDDSKDESEDKKEKEKPKSDEKQKKDKSPDKSDEAGTQKEAKSSNETSGKQEGLSNATTDHSTNVADDPDKSSKGEGAAETAKLKGTVSTDRPQK